MNLTITVVVFLVFLVCMILYVLLDSEILSRREYKYKVDTSEPYKKMRTLDLTYSVELKGSKVVRSLLVHCPTGTEHYDVEKRIYDYKTDKGYMIAKKVGSKPEDWYNIFLVDIDTKHGTVIDKTTLMYSGKCNYLVFETKESMDWFITKYLNNGQ